MKLAVCNLITGHVGTKENLADGPSRNDFELLQTLGAQELTGWDWPEFRNDLGSWLSRVSESERAVFC